MRPMVKSEEKYSYRDYLLGYQYLVGKKSHRRNNHNSNLCMFDLKMRMSAHIGNGEPKMTLLTIMRPYCK